MLCIPIVEAVRFSFLVEDQNVALGGVVGDCFFVDTLSYVLEEGVLDGFSRSYA